MNINDEQLTDEIQNSDLSVVFSRRLKVSAAIIGIAEQLYAARTMWLGDGAIPWAHLTVGQRRMYRAEVESLVKGCGHTAQVRPTFEGRTEELRTGVSSGDAAASGLAIVPADPRD